MTSNEVNNGHYLPHAQFRQRQDKRAIGFSDLGKTEHKVRGFALNLPFSALFFKTSISQKRE